MRKFLTAALLVWILITVFIVVRRLHLPEGVGMFIVFVTMAAMCIWAAKQQVIADRLRLQQTAAKFGFKPVEPGEVEISIEPLRGPGWVQGAACGELRGLKTWIFDYDIRDSGRDTKSIRQTVVAFRADEANLPIFLIRPLGMNSSIGDSQNTDDSVCFPDALHFHRRFELVSSAEEGVRRHFDAKLLDTIASLNEWNYCVQGYYTTVLFFAPKKAILKPDAMEAFARKGADIAYAIFSTEKRVLAAAAE